MGIGVAGTGISACGPAIGMGTDITDRQAAQAMPNQAIIPYGGINNMIVTATDLPLVWGHLMHAHPD